MFLKRGDLIQYNKSYWPSDAEKGDWVMGLCMGTNLREPHTMQVLWFDDFQDTRETNPLEGDDYRMFSPGSSVG